MDMERARFNMVEQQIRPWRVLDEAVLAAHFHLKRENFVPASMLNLAFSDVEIPLIIDGNDTGERMLSPKLDARLLQAVAIRRGETVLEIGTGSGWMSALLADRAMRVLSFEVNPILAAFAKANLNRQGITQVEVTQANAVTEIDGQWDVIVACGGLELVPDFLLSALKPGGRLAVIVGKAPIMLAQCITKQAQGGFRTENLFETLVPMLHDFPRAARFAL
ncbi:MAG: protein-L-isoaspartate O-methyltransferase [Betaproteobacteria bacterium]|nr:protein-L-isoaspartate O-methyltransferase [Betaproteobacteria bacterium]NDD11085.1 protein-L-isoaspartate O-methyltransferase [Betaproteobacteria bacterium]